MCTGGRSRPGGSLGAGGVSVSSNILALSSPTLSWDYGLCPRHQTSDHADTPTWASPPSNPVQPLRAPSSLWTLPPSAEPQGLSLDFLLPRPSQTLTGSRGSAGWRSWPSSASAVAWSRAAQKYPGWSSWQRRPWRWGRHRQRPSPAEHLSEQGGREGTESIPNFCHLTQAQALLCTCCCRHPQSHSHRAGSLESHCLDPRTQAVRENG